MRIVFGCTFVAIAQLACASAGPGEGGRCDLNQLYKEHFGSGWTQTAPSWGSCTCEVSPALRSYQCRDPSEDVAAAVARGDHALVGVMEYAVVTPGAQLADREALGYSTIEGTSDQIECYEHLRLHLIARDYAERYNRQLLEQLR